MIPESFGSLANLRRINLSSNHIEGPIPPNLGMLSNLLLIRLDNNLLSGTIPDLSGLTRLQSLRLQNNSLTGEIPESLAALTNLTDISLGNNMLTATSETVLAMLATLSPEWAATQTVPPTDVQALIGTSIVELRWTPIAYTGDGGYYEVSFSDTLGGPYQVHGVTADKSSNHYVIGDLTAPGTYYFVVRTFTPAQNRQQQHHFSEYTPEVAAEFGGQ